jgi:zinc transporter 1
MFGLTGSFFVVELVVGHLTNSMALIADSFHMLSDIAALIIAFISVKMAPKSWDKNTFGWARAEVLGALVNAVFLVALCFSITMEALKRFYEPEKIHDPELILTVGALGLVVNLLGLCLFHEHGGHGHSHGHTQDRGTHSHISALANRDGEEGEKNEQGNLTSVTVQGKHETHSHGHSHGKEDSTGNLNMRGVFLHVMADALGSVIVIISALVMWQAPDWRFAIYVDPGLSLIMVMLMMWSVWPLLIESALILLQTVPTHIDIEKLKRKLLENIDGILAVHEFHVWQLAGDRIIASAHIRCLNLSEYMKIAENVKEFFHNEGIHSTTIQPEFVEVNGQGKNVERKSRANSYGFNGLNAGNIDEDDCMLGCPKAPEMEEPSCQKSKCCVPTKDENKNGGGSNGLLGMTVAGGSSKSAQNTPINSRKRPSSFVLNTEDVGGENGEVQIQLTSSFATSKHDSL